MRILFLIAMLAVVGLVGWLWFESDSQPQRTVPTESASVIPDIQKLKELEDRSVLLKDSQSTEPAPALSGAARAAKKAEEAVKLSAEKSEKHSLPDALVLEEMTIGNLETATCLRFGPVGERRLPELRRGIERSGLIGRLVMEETDASVYMVYSGPFKSEGKAKQELKRLTDFGLQGASIIKFSATGWAVLMGKTHIRPKAKLWAEEAARAFNESIVIDEERRHNKAFNLIFPGLSSRKLRGATTCRAPSSLLAINLLRFRYCCERCCVSFGSIASALFRRIFMISALTSRCLVPQGHSGYQPSSFQRAITCQCRCGTILPNSARFILSGASESRIVSSVVSRRSHR